jgi:phosphotransferase system enzyme I (PtsP)
MKSQGKKTAGKKTARIAPLFTRRKQEREKTQSYIQRLTALSEISHSITSSLDLRTILELLLEKIDSFLPHYAAINIRLLNRKTGKLEPVACRGINEEEWKAVMAKPKAGLPRLALQTKGPLIVSNAQIHPETLHPDFLRKHGLVSYLGIPLMAKGEDMGVLSVLTKEEHSFRDEEIKFLTTLAGQAAIAIHNSQLYD